ncbi:MAG: SPASM domain-containing protein, partial [Nitrospirae bacterium]|nr:SPASM domain-containing protein [Nitrospirota bacterium]
GFNVTSITTNGLLLHKKMDLIFENLNSIVISLDGYNAETYNKQRGGTEDTYNTVINNISNLVKERDKDKNKNFKIELNCIIGRFNLDYIEPMINKAEELGVDRMRFGSFHPTNNDKSIYSPIYLGEKDVEEIYKYLMSKTDWNTDITLPSLYGNRKIFWCSMLSEMVVIGAKGDFSPCCQMPPDTKYGNFFDTPNSYNKGNAAQFRRQFYFAKSYNELPLSCRECPRLSPIRNQFSSKLKIWDSDGQHYI